MIGLNNVPYAGDEFEVVDSLDIARERAEERAISLRDERILAKAGDGRITLSSFASAVTTGKNSGLDLHQLNIVMKVDLQVSLSTSFSRNHKWVCNYSLKTPLKLSKIMI